MILRMTKKDLIELIAENKKVFVLIFCVIFGVIAGESFNMLKFPQKPKFKLILPKIIVASFVCVVFSPLIDDYLKWKQYYPYCILGIAIVSFPLLDWIVTTLFPVLLSVLQQSMTGLITKLIGKHKKDDTK